jgi:hypothetical protein
MPRVHDGRFVDQVGQVGPSQFGCDGGHIGQRNLRVKRHFAHIHAQDVDAAFFVELVHQHLAVKATCPQQGGV